MKRILSVALAMIIAFSALAVGVYADDSAIKNVRVTQLDEAEGDCDRIVNWYEVNGEYYLFVPASINAEEAIFEVETAEGKKAYVNGAEYSAPKTVAEVFGDKTSVTLKADGKEYKVILFAESKVASVFIQTESGSLDYIHEKKGNEEEGFVEIIGADGDVAYDGALEIKGRGNSTWQMEKKPYNIKLDKKTNLFGMGKTKKWSLIANHSDSSMIRNVLAYQAAENAGMPYAPQFTPVDVYINNDYMGAYLLTTRIGIDPSNVDIEDLEGETEKANPEDLDTYPRAGAYGTYAGLLAGTKKWFDIPNDPDDITGGYIIEMELANRYYDELSGFVTARNKPFTMKTPECITKAQVDYISGVYQKFEDAVYAGASMEELDKLCNVESLAQLYLINEWCSNMDAGLTSTYFYKPAGENESLYAGPVWDFDIGFGNNEGTRYGNDYNDPTKWTVCYNRMYRNTVFGAWDIDEQPTVFNVLTKNATFVAKLNEYWNGGISAALNETVSWTKNTYVPSIEGSTVANALRWNIYDTTDIVKIKSEFAKDTEYVINFANTKAATISAGVANVQNDAPETNAVLKFFKDILVKVNDMFESIIVKFDLVNKI